MKLELLGKEVRYKKVKHIGTGGGVYLPVEWVGHDVAIVLDADKADEITKFNNGSQKVVYSYFVCDLLHRGHILHMERAKAVAGPNGLSVVGILTDDAVKEKKPAPMLSFDERMELARSVKYNDVVVSQDTYSPLPNLYRIKPDIVLESDSHDPEHIHKVDEYMKEIKGKVIICPYYPGISSTKLKQRAKEVK